MVSQSRADHEDQIIYKLGSIEARMDSFQEQLTNLCKTLEEKIDSSAKNQGIENHALKNTIMKLEARLMLLEQWRQNLLMKMGFFVSSVSVFWIVFGVPVENLVKGVFGGGN